MMLRWLAAGLALGMIFATPFASAGTRVTMPGAAGVPGLCPDGSISSPTADGAMLLPGHDCSASYELAHPAATRVVSVDVTFRSLVPGAYVCARIYFGGFHGGVAGDCHPDGTRVTLGFQPAGSSATPPINSVMWTGVREGDRASSYGVLHAIHLETSA